jgi:hypothetical protein
MPKKTNGYTQVKAHAKQDRKRREAYARQDKYDALPLAEKLKTMGAKHRARWDKQQAALAKKKPAPAPAATPATVEVKPKKAYQKPKKS